MAQHQIWYRLKASIDREVCVGGEQERIGQSFREADQARVGDAHRHIRILVEQVQDR
jgi:hypothetical protein